MVSGFCHFWFQSVIPSIMSNSLWPHGLWLARLFCPRHSPGKNTGVGHHSLLQGIFPTQGSDPVSGVSCIGRRILYHHTTWEADRLLYRHVFCLFVLGMYPEMKLLSHNENFMITIFRSFYFPKLLEHFVFPWAMYVWDPISQKLQCLLLSFWVFRSPLVSVAICCQLRAFEGPKINLDGKDCSAYHCLGLQNSSRNTTKLLIW